jgi:hypothetical protein
MSDASFEQILAAQNKEFDAAEVFSTWMPPDGEYVVQVKKVSSGTKKDEASGTFAPWWKMLGVILVEAGDPKLKGAEFTLAFFMPKTYGMMKGAACILANKPIMSSLKEASDIILASTGAVLKVKVETRETKRGKFTGCSILSVIPTEGMPQQETPATEPPALT